MLTCHLSPLVRTQCSNVLGEVERALGEALMSIADTPTPNAGQQRHLLDVGCWDGAATTRYAASIGARPSGIEIFPEPGSIATRRGVDVVRVDLERDRFPWRDSTFDMVISNQVFEHLKNIWLPLAEVFRVLRPGGHFIISVPNLASLHNRLLLLCGVQPTSIRTIGPHVRGYTSGSLIELLSLDGALAHCRTIGVGFYPFPSLLAGPLARLWPSGSHTVIVVMRKVEHRSRSPWLPFGEEHGDVIAQTYYR